MQTCKQFACSLHTSSRASFQAACGQLAYKLVCELPSSSRSVCVPAPCMEAGAQAGKQHAWRLCASCMPGCMQLGGVGEVGVLTQVPTWAERRSPSAACKLRSSADTFSSSARRSRSPRRSVSSCSSRAACALPSLPSAPRRPAAATPRVANLRWGLWGAHEWGRTGLPGFVRDAWGFHRFYWGARGGGSNFTGLYGDSILYFVMFF